MAAGAMGQSKPDYGGFCVETFPAGDVEARPHRFSPAEDQAKICRDVLSARQGEAGDESRQLPSRLRRAVRAWLQCECQRSTY